MSGPYTFVRKQDGPGNIIQAAHVNELQQALEELGILRAPSFVAGRRYGCETALLGAFSTSVAISANQLYATPFWTGPSGITFTNLNINVSVSAAGNARLGIYAADTDPPYYPAALLLDAGTVSVSSTGVKTIDIADTLYIGVVPSRLIWLALVSDVTPTLSTIQGQSSLIQISTAGLTNAGVQMAHTYAALPGTFDDPPDAEVLTTPQIWTVAG